MTRFGPGASQNISKIDMARLGRHLGGGRTDQGFQKWDPEVILKDEYTPAVFNNPDLVKKLQFSFERSLGSENVFKTSPVMGGEDFGMFGRDEPIIPTALFWLGAVNKEVYDRSKKDNIALPSLHSDLFLPDPEPTIETGITAMTQAAIDLFREDLQGP